MDMIELTDCLSYSFVDHNIFMRHFGLGIGHLQYECQHEMRPDDHENGMVLDLDDSDCSDISDLLTDNLNTWDSIPDPEIGLDSDEEESHNVHLEGIDDWGSEGDMSDIISASESDGSNCTNNGYTSF
jgi:hypothetical protein